MLDRFLGRFFSYVFDMRHFGCKSMLFLDYTDI